ncbi:MAG: ribbon-helix-helix protein, CopG family [Geodermatophilaceae bacterium]
MKTAISLPEDTFDAATRRARALGMSRSEFFAIAARRYLDHLDRMSLTAQIDAALAVADVDDSSGHAIASGRARLADTHDW